MNKTENILTLFQDGLNCSQIVFSSFAERFGLDKDAALRIASGFGAGMGRMSLTCGAVTGAFMALGLKYGYASGESKESKEKIYALVREFAEKFRAIHGSIECRELVGFDISTPDGYKEASDNGLFRTLCPQFVKSAVEIAEKMIVP